MFLSLFLGFKPRRGRTLLFLYFSSATFWGSGWTVGSLFSKLGNMVEGHWKRTRTEAHTQLSKGGAIALSWKLKLWTGVAQALFNSQPCNFCPHMRPTISYNFAALTYDLWPLDLPPFWIKWKTLKIYLLLGFSYKVHEMFYTWTLDRNGQNVVIRFFFKLKNEVFMSQWKLQVLCKLFFCP